MIHDASIQICLFLFFYVLLWKLNLTWDPSFSRIVTCHDILKERGVGGPSLHAQIYDLKNDMSNRATDREHYSFSWDPKFISWSF